MHVSNILRLGVKELRSLQRDWMMLFLIVFSFTLNIVMAGTGMPETLHKAPIAIVDEDQSQLSRRITQAFYPPEFTTPAVVPQGVVDAGMDAGRYTFALDIPPNFQRDVLAGRRPAVQLNVDATRTSQAFVGAGFIQQIVGLEVAEFVQRYRGGVEPRPRLEVRARFNPTLDPEWFAAIMEVINNVTMVSIVLTGAALIREREHGTIEHLLVMPVSAFEIMASKVWAMALVVLLACAFSVLLVVEGLMAVPIEGSISLFLFATLLQLFATTSMGIFMATLARSMPQFALLLMLVILPLQLLSGGVTPRESLPDAVALLMEAAPTTHFVKLAQDVLYRGAGLDVVWPQLVAITAIGVIFFGIALSRFRKTIAAMA